MVKLKPDFHNKMISLYRNTFDDKLKKIPSKDTIITGKIYET
jgi:hypothetical protein